MSYQPCDIIKNAIKNNKLSHAYLFYGDKGVDVEKHSFEAIKLIIKLSGKDVDVNSIKDINYYDLKIIEPGSEAIIKKENVDSTINKLFETSLVKGAIKILYIKDIDLGNKHSLNRLLKFIEEPVDNLVVIMNTNHFDQVISTIKSRAQNIYIKRENILTKINEMKPIINDFAPLAANIYANTNQLKSIDLKSFEQTYNQIIDALKSTLSSKYNFKEMINNIWTKDTNHFVLNILQFFFYQLMIQIDDENPLFPNCYNLIIEYKKKNLDCFKIQMLIEKVKKSINHYANFNLQKMNFLNEIEILL